MNVGRSEKYFQYLMDKSCDAHLVDMWLATHYDENDEDIADCIAFEERREIFFWLLGCALDSGRLRLKKNGEYLTGTPEELVQRFRDVLPKSDLPYPSHPHLDVSDWFFDPQCPGEAVWRVEHPDGRVEWRHCP